MADETWKLTVRMYCHGLGDCFLIRVREGKKIRNILIDCGVLLGTPAAAERMRAVADSIAKTCEGKIDLLIITHEHWDHFSGFLHARDIFAQLSVDRLWLAWTEDPKNPLAQRLRSARREVLGELREAQKRGVVGVGTPQAQFMESLLAFHGIGDSLPGLPAKPTATGDVWGIEEVLAPLNVGKREYLSPGQIREPLSSVPGLRAFVLGPPASAEIARSDPRNGEAYAAPIFALSNPEHYLDRLRAASGLSSGGPGSKSSVDNGMPFEAKWIAAERPSADSLPGLNLLEADAGAAVASSLALKLDSDTNNTSLALAFEWEGEGVLLFPGDAQAGSWRSWHTVKFPKEPGTGAAELLARTVFYKVGHHGSHNATLKAKGLEMMTDPNLVAMIPVEVETARKKGWDEMPYENLVARLRERAPDRIVQSDSPARPAGIHESRFNSGPPAPSLNGRPLYVEYTVY